VGQAGAGNHHGQVNDRAHRSGQIKPESRRVTGAEPGGPPPRSTATTHSQIVVHAGSAYYAAAFIAACRRAGARFSVTVRMDPKIRRTITSIDDHAWVAIKYPNAIFDDQAGQWISDAEIADVPYTAFATNRAHRTEGRLIVRRVRRLNPKAAAQGQGELFATYRYHAVFTDSPFQLTQAESQHRGTPSSSRSSPM
jgi:hypothetical protein